MTAMTDAPRGLRDVLDDAVRYWEKRRIVYNLALAVVTVAWGVALWPRVRAVWHIQSIAALVVLAVLANVCYCAAYLVDVPIQFSSFRQAWRSRRWMLWLFGTLFGMAVAYFWIGDEILPALAR